MTQNKDCYSSNISFKVFPKSLIVGVVIPESDSELGIQYFFYYARFVSIALCVFSSNGVIKQVGYWFV